MKRSLLYTAITILFFTSNIMANKSNTSTTCNNTPMCIDDKKFSIVVKKIMRRGHTVIIQIEYTSKVKYVSIGFSTIYVAGGVTLLDNRGEEFVIKGKEIANFKLRKNEKKILSFKFKGDEKKPISEPFDLILKTNQGELTLFNLKSSTDSKQN